MFNEKGIKKLDLNAIVKKDDQERFLKSKSLIQNQNRSTTVEFNEKDVFLFFIKVEIY